MKRLYQTLQRSIIIKNQIQNKVWVPVIQIFRVNYLNNHRMTINYIRTYNKQRAHLRKGGKNLNRYWSILRKGLIL